LPGWLIAAASLALGLVGGAALALAFLRARLPHATRPAAPAPTPATPAASTGVDLAEVSSGVATLLEGALRRPLARLRRLGACPTDLVAEFERVAWQARMLRALPRPLQARPHSPIALLESAAEQVELLRLGKVPTSWTLRNRQPVLVDAERAGAALRELLTTCAAEAGEGGRIAVRILPGREPRHPVCVELEIGRRGAEPDPLALLVARRLLEGQGARVEADATLVRIELRGVVVEQPPPPQTVSNS
jgi:hypothetical protein